MFENKKIKICYNNGQNLNFKKIKINKEGVRISPCFSIGFLYLDLKKFKESI